MNSECCSMDSLMIYLMQSTHLSTIVKLLYKNKMLFKPNYFYLSHVQGSRHTSALSNYPLYFVSACILGTLVFFRFVCEISKDLAFRKKCARSCVMPKIGEGKYICLSELFCIVTEIQVLMNLRLELVLSPTAKKFISTMWRYAGRIIILNLNWRRWRSG